MKDPYDVLGVPRDASIEEIQAAHLRRSQEMLDRCDPVGFDEMQQAIDELIARFARRGRRGTPSAN
jgi:hypothetical protein